MRKSRKENITLLKKFLDDLDRNNTNVTPKRGRDRGSLGKLKP
jgi:hypothetical protein